MTELLKLTACIVGVFFFYSSLHYLMQGNVVMFVAVLPLTSAFVWWYSRYMNVQKEI